MLRKRSIKFTVFAAGLLSALLFWSLPVLAQCALCKNAVTGSPEAARLSQSLNFAILILLIPPVLIFCGIFAVAYRYRKSRGTAQVQSSSETGTRKNHEAEREAGGALA